MSKRGSPSKNKTYTREEALAYLTATQRQEVALAENARARAKRLTDEANEQNARFRIACVRLVHSGLTQRIVCAVFGMSKARLAQIVEQELGRRK